jgi:hypothetical protein
MITKDRFTAIVLILFVWGLAGGVFGALFAGLHQVLSALGLTGWQPLVAAAATAAMTTSALYSAMPVALTGAMAGVLASIGALILLGQYVSLGEIVGAAALTGVAGGGFYAWMADSHGQPLVETLAGLGAGLIAGTTLAALVTLTGYQAGTFVLAAGVVALVGALFQISQRWLATAGSDWVHGGLSAAVVAGLMASLVAAGIWILGGTTALTLESATSDALGQIGGEIPPGFIGGLMGGAVTGVILELFGFHLEEHD